MPRNSIMSGFGGPEKIKDARPLHDKSFVQQCIRQLHEVKTLYFSVYVMYMHTKRFVCSNIATPFMFNTLNPLCGMWKSLTLVPHSGWIQKVTVADGSICLIELLSTAATAHCLCLCDDMFTTQRSEVLLVIYFTQWCFVTKLQHLWIYISMISILANIRFVFYVFIYLYYYIHTD